MAHKHTLTRDRLRVKNNPKLKKKLLGDSSCSDDPVEFISNRAFRTCFTRTASRNPDPLEQGIFSDKLHLLSSTRKLFGALSFRTPEILPYKQLDMPIVLQRLVDLDKAGFDSHDSQAQPKLRDTVEMAADILCILRRKSDDPAGFDEDCVVCAIKLNSDLASRAVVLFFEQTAKPQQRLLKLFEEVGLEFLMGPVTIRPELLVELGIVSRGQLRNRIIQAFKNIGRPDLIASLGSGGPPIVELEPVLEESMA